VIDATQDSASRPAIDVAICVVTYKRPVGITRCLESLAELRLGARAGAAPRIVVVDNDPAGSGRAAVAAAAARLPWPVRYEVEPARGVTFALNRAIALAGPCDFVALLDDDEFAEPAWLDALLDTQRRYDAEVVTGPVLSVFAQPVPAWMAAERCFNRPRMATGTPLAYARTGNVLIRRGALAWVPGPFDARFALSGGQDTFLFKQLARAGARIVWCDEAVVRETVPPSRTTLRWMLTRAYRVGNSIALCERAMPAPWRRSAAGVLRDGCAHIARGAVKFPPSLVRGRTKAVGQLRDIAAGAGMIAGLLGWRYEEYRRVHGT
jgi:succinoglycan biosynthesis protein ExoM